MPDGSPTAKRRRSPPRGKKRWDKSKLPSRHTTVGPERAPHRSYLYAMGLSQEEIEQPLVGVATCWNEAAPCNISLSRQAQAAKRGVKYIVETGGSTRDQEVIDAANEYGMVMALSGVRLFHH